jgi:predicted DNA-binding transcriptional regulator AlpA
MTTILRYGDLERRGIGSRVTLWRWVRAGKFPAPRDINGRPGWLENEVEEFLNSRPPAAIAQRGAA